MSKISGSLRIEISLDLAQSERLRAAHSWAIALSLWVQSLGQEEAAVCPTAVCAPGQYPAKLTWQLLFPQPTRQPLRVF